MSYQGPATLPTYPGPAAMPIYQKPEAPEHPGLGSSITQFVKHVYHRLRHYLLQLIGFLVGLTPLTFILPADPDATDVDSGFTKKVKHVSCLSGPTGMGTSLLERLIERGGKRVRW